MARIRTGRAPAATATASKPKGKGKIHSKRPSTNLANAYSFDSKAKGRAAARAKVHEDEALAAKGNGKARARPTAINAVDDEEDEEEDEWNGIHDFKMGGDDEPIDFTDDDEDIDSDEADTDGEDAAPPAAIAAKRQSMTKTIHTNGDINLDEDEASDGEEDGFNIDEMLDRPDLQAESDDSSDEADEMEGGSEDGLEKLDAFVANLPAKSTREGEDENGEAPRKRRRVAQELTEAAAENEYAAIGVRDQGKLRLEDLLSTLPAAQRAQMKKSLKPLATVADATPNSGKNPLKAKGPLPAPLPHLYQEKIDREAANEVLGKELEGWNDTLRTMKGIGKAGQEFGENRLSLPLGAPTGPSVPLNGADVMAKFSAGNDLEKSVQQILEAARITPRALNEAETAALAALPPAEAASRVAEVRRQRELLFRAERKAKRVAKIKSKTYHRIQKKARRRAEAEGEMTLEELQQLDEVDGGDRAREMREKMETIRAKERATLRHAPGASKWSQAMKGIEGLDESGRAAMQERAERAEELRRKVLGIEEDGSEEDSDAARSVDDDDEDMDEAAIRASAFDELATLDRKEAELAAQSKSSGLAGMKFMQRAAAVEKQRADDLADDFRAELEGRPEGDSDAEQVTDHRVQNNAGRFSFAPSKMPATDAPTAKSKKREQKVQTTGAIDLPAPEPRPLPNPFASLSSFSNDASAASNPWLSLGDPDAAKKISRKRDNVQPTAADKITAKAEKRKKRSEEGRKAAAVEAEVVVEPDAALADSDEDETADEPVHLGKRKTAFEQHELVARAFANDDVVADFAEAKRQETEADAPHEVDETLPGWGAWGGRGAPKSKKQRVIRHVPGIDATKRQDAKLNHVIISERRDKKSTKYLVKDLPFPYTNAAQREMALREPMGQEWATATTMKIATKPEVMARPGVLITPVSKAL